jgi:mRNA-degrading endonuclease toxin of MazEF toxin-antitoxin module
MHRVGHIVIVSDVLDPQGRNSKDRPCVVVGVSSADDAETLYRVVGITTSLPAELTPDHVPIPWQRPRHPETGLNERNAALCSWVVRVDESRIIRRIGDTPPRRLLEIAEALKRLAEGLGSSTP